jgi:cell division protein FtsW (lipid II flippase)
LRPEHISFTFPAADIWNRLFGTAAIFIFAFSLALTVSPAVRMHTWQVNILWIHWFGFITWLSGFYFLGRFQTRVLPDADPILIPLVSFLTGWGLMTIYRVDPYFGLRQTAWLALSIGLLWFILRTEGFVAVFHRYKYLWLTLGIALLALTLLIGVYPGGFGPQLWLGFAGVYFQPSELLKLLLVVFLAAYLSDRLRIAFNFTQLATPALIIFGIAIVILLVQRDLGTSALLLILFSIMLFMAAGKYWQILLSVAGLALAAFIGYHLFDVIRLRVDSWINPWLDPSGRSYQIVQSIMAVSSGGIFGRGPGLGSPRVVPVAQSDFIFSAIAEETGLVGVIGLICLMILLVHRGFRIAFRSRSVYHRLLAAGVTSFLAFQSILIIGGNLRVLPLTGVTLPFMSYGGSSLVVSMICAGILVKLSDTEGEDPAFLEKPAPYFFIAGTAIAGFVGILLASGWWSMIRSNSLLTRTDNPRLGINERYSPRGNILDNAGEKINMTSGVSGNFKRFYLYPPLSPVFGFNTSSYGQTGLESALDGFLRGERGVPSSIIWWNHLVHGQPPPGLDIKTTIDMRLQQEADQLLEGRKGALVLLNALSGDVLAMSSHPNVDPNQAEDMWSGWMQDIQSPLLNRATQASYPLGTMLTPFLLAERQYSIQGREPPGSMDIQYKGVNYTCGFSPGRADSWAAGIIAGCPAPSVNLAGSFSVEEISQVIEKYGLSSLPEFILPQAAIDSRPTPGEPESLIFGEDQLRASPLQIALAASAITNGSFVPTPLLAVSYRSPEGWIYFPHGRNDGKFDPSAGSIRNMLSSDDYPGWEASGRSKSSQGTFSWFIGGTAADWEGIPLALALLMEEDAPLDARRIGTGLLTAATNPY